MSTATAAPWCWPRNANAACFVTTPTCACAACTTSATPPLPPLPPPLLGVPPGTIARGLQAFTGLPHRLEWIADKGGVAYYNDSKATTPFSTQSALRAFEQPVLLLAGGYDKGTPFDDLAHVMQSRVRVALLYGNTAPKLAAALERVSSPPDVIQLPTLDAALQRAADLARPGDVVLLSPACASYDQFPHYEARGDHFRALVGNLP